MSKITCNSLEELQQHIGKALRYAQRQNFVERFHFPDDIYSGPGTRVWARERDRLRAIERDDIIRQQYEQYLEEFKVVGPGELFDESPLEQWEWELLGYANYAV